MTKHQAQVRAAWALALFVIGACLLLGVSFGAKWGLAALAVFLIGLGFYGLVQAGKLKEQQGR